MALPQRALLPYMSRLLRDMNTRGNNLINGKNNQQSITGCHNRSKPLISVEYTTVADKFFHLWEGYLKTPDAKYLF